MMEGVEMNQFGRLQTEEGVIAEPAGRVLDGLVDIEVMGNVWPWGCPWYCADANEAEKIKDRIRDLGLEREYFKTACRLLGIGEIDAESMTATAAVSEATLEITCKAAILTARAARLPSASAAKSQLMRKIAGDEE